MNGAIKLNHQVKPKPQATKWRPPSTTNVVPVANAKLVVNATMACATSSASPTRRRGVVEAAF
jgi:hypothetical protein